MDQNQFKSLPELKVGDILMDISDLDDQSDRTLFYGSYFLRDRRVTHHSYVKDCCLHVVIYASGNELLATVSARELSALVLVPKAKMMPACCDFQASEFFLISGADVQFLDDYSSISRHEYVGALLGDLESMHLKFHGIDSLNDVKARRVLEFLSENPGKE